MGIFTKEVGRMERQMAMVFILIKMAQCIRENGSMISIMAKALRPGIMELLSMREISRRLRKLDRADSNSMEITMKEILRMDSLRGKASITLLILEKFIMENSMKIILLGMEL